MTATDSPRRLWWLLVAFTLCYVALFAAIPRLLPLVGVNHYGVWFLDSYAILASNDALGIGRDAYLYNPLDPLGRAHVYSHWWLHLRDLGLTRAQNFPLGLAWGLAFFVAAFARLRPREPREVLWYLVVLGSSPVLLAINRANNDLIVFALLAPVVPCLLAAPRHLQWLAILLIALATGLKYYPAIAGLVLLAGTDQREVRLRVLVGALALALVAANIAPDLLRAGVSAPKAEGLMTFGAANIFEPARQNVLNLTIPWLSVAAFAIVFILGVRRLRRWVLRPHDQGMWLSFVLGAALLTGCFFTGRNFGYRWVFALWLAPLLWSLPRDPLAPVRVRRFAALTAALLVVALWFDALASLGLGLFRGGATSTELLRWGDRFFSASNRSRGRSSRACSRFSRTSRGTECACCSPANNAPRYRSCDATARSMRACHADSEPPVASAISCAFSR